MKELTQEYLKTLLEYEEKTGIFTRKISRGGKLKGSVAGTTNLQGYTVISIDDTLYLTHRLAWLYMKGLWPTFNIDHINNMKEDNRFSNLREATDSENNMNTLKRVDNTSGVKGVSFNKKSGKWVASVWHKKKQYRLGYFNTIEEASESIRFKREELHKEFANHG